MSDGITYRWLTEADLKEIVRRETEALRALLVESRGLVSGCSEQGLGCSCLDCRTAKDVIARIDTALAAMTEKP